MFWRLIPLMILAFALQTTWFGGLRLGSAPLNLVFGVALCGAMLGGARVGFWCGLGAGYLMGLGAMWHPGSFLVSHLLPCVLVGLAASKFEVSHFLSPVLVAILGTSLSQIVFLLLSPTEFSLAFWGTLTLWQIAAQALLSWPLFALVRHFVAPRRELVWS